MTPHAPIAPRTMAWLRQSRPLVRRVLLYAAAGPGVTLLLAAVFRTIDVGALLLLLTFQTALGLGFFAIVRPASYAGSPWRAMGATLWLSGPLVLFASDALPAVVLLDHQVWPDLAGDKLYTLWTAVWLGAGTLGSLLSAIVSSLPTRFRAAGRATHRVWPYLRMGIVIAILGLTALGITLGWMTVSALMAIPLTHVSANVPGRDHFDALMRRDLAGYFASPDSTPMTLDYDLLRRGSTQTGIAYPKYYAWVRVRSADTTFQGAVRIAAVDQERFEVRQFMTSDEILADPERVRQTFPEALSQELVRRARQVGH